MTNDKRSQAMIDIISAAVDSISENGIAGATVRDIASRASVNPAAISYYFGNRDNLIKTAFKVSLENAFDLEEFTFDASADYHVVFRTYLEHWMKGITQYAGLTRAHFDEVIHQRDNSGAITVGFNHFIDGIYALMVKHGLNDSKETHEKTRLIFGAFISGMLLPDIFKPVKDADAFLDALLNMI